MIKKLYLFIMGFAAICGCEQPPGATTTAQSADAKNKTLSTEKIPAPTVTVVQERENSNSANQDGADSSQANASVNVATSPNTSTSTHSTSSTNAVTPATVETTASQPVSCENRNAWKSDNINLSIPKNLPNQGGTRCPYGKDDNNVKTSSEYSARVERRFDINIPPDRIVCSMETNGPQQTIHFDDHLFLNLNDYVLIANHGIPTEKFQLGSNGFFRYDWSKIRGTDAKGSSTCASGTTCQVPKSDTSGELSFKISESAGKQLFGSLAGQSLFLTIVLTGDNDDSDCAQLTDLNLDLSYSYVQK